MKSPALALRTASAIFGVIALAHLVRILAAIDVRIGGIYIQRRWSILAILATIGLCVWLWKAACAVGGSKDDNAAKPAA